MRASKGRLTITQLLYSAQSTFESTIASQNLYRGASSHRTAHFLTERLMISSSQYI
jgi:hypothetical protein